MPKELSLKFHNTYAELPESFYSSTVPEQVANPSLVKINQELAAELGFSPDDYTEQYLAEVFSGNKLLAGSEPLAQAYAGHQFGGLSPQLGDGRACLLGEVLSSSGKSLDLQLKGSGRTAYSRRGDGKATLYSALREYLISEAMHALKIPTTRSLAVVASGQNIMREGYVPAGVLTRIASSHIRVGTFQYFAIRGELDSIKILADYSIQKHYPDIAEQKNPYLALIESVMERQIHLITQWMRVGFIHGVKNTDNVTISGETIDYGPCAFLDNYDPQAKFSSIDSQGRYAFSNQGPIGLWNLARFSETLITLIDSDEDKAIAQLTELLETYASKFADSYSAMMHKKFGILGNDPSDAQVVNEFLDILHADKVDYTLAFRELNSMVENNFTKDDLSKLISSSERYETWKIQWKYSLHDDAGELKANLEQMQCSNPIYIPRNWHVEEALNKAATENDFSLFNDMLDVLKNPYTQQDAFAKYASTPYPSTNDYQTFCGT